MKKYKGLRNGDVSLHPITELPENLVKVEHKGDFVVAHGESGNSHRVKVADPKHMNIYKDLQGRYVLEFLEKGEIVHEEHKPITIERGIYVQEIDTEFDPFQDLIREVKD